jgi:flagellar biosynthesis protein FlhF
MKMKRISAATIQEALATARRELGEDAVLLETKKSTNPKGVIVTFAVDEPEEPLFNDDARFDSPADILPFSPGIARATTARAEINHPAIDLIQQALAYHGLPEGLSNRIMLTLNKISLKPDSLIEVAHTALADALSETIAFKAIATATKIPPERALMLVGPHGAGKTSAIAKLATELTLQKQKVVLVSTDLERMGGTDSLLKLSSILGCPFHVCESRAQLKALLPEHQNKAWVLIDSTGANIYEFTPMKSLGELASLQAVEPILTCPAGMDADEATEMASVFDFLAIERMIVTRLDAVRRLKSVFAALTTGGYALSNLSNSARPSDSCQTLSPIALARLMLRHERERLSQ